MSLSMVLKEATFGIMWLDIYISLKDEHDDYVPKDNKPSKWHEYFSLRKT